MDLRPNPFSADAFSAPFVEATWPHPRATIFNNAAPAAAAPAAAAGGGADADDTTATAAADTDTTTTTASLLSHVADIRTALGRLRRAVVDTNVGMRDAAADKHSQYHKVVNMRMLLDAVEHPDDDADWREVRDEVSQLVAAIERKTQEKSKRVMAAHVVFQRQRSTLSECYTSVLELVRELRETQGSIEEALDAFTAQGFGSELEFGGSEPVPPIAAANAFDDSYV